MMVLNLAGGACVQGQQIYKTLPKLSVSDALCSLVIWAVTELCEHCYGDQMPCSQSSPEPGD